MNNADDELQPAMRIETYFGYIQCTEDALIIFEACRQGLLKQTSRRLSPEQRRNIKSGDVFVFEESQSGIKRWTDGMIWSPSRILDNFLVYREADRKEAAPRNLAEYNFPSGAVRGALSKDSQEEPQGPLTSQKGTYYFKQGGLIKKTISTMVGGLQQHMVCYYTKEDVEMGRLIRPCFNVALRDVVVPLDFIESQAFRRPQKTIREMRKEERAHELSSSRRNSTPSVSSGYTDEIASDMASDDMYVYTDGGLRVNMLLLANEHVDQIVAEPQSARSVMSSNSLYRRSNSNSQSPEEYRTTVIPFANSSNASDTSVGRTVWPTTYNNSKSIQDEIDAMTDPVSILVGLHNRNNTSPPYPALDFRQSPATHFSENFTQLNVLTAAIDHARYLQENSTQSLQPLQQVVVVDTSFEKSDDFCRQSPDRRSSSSVVVDTTATRHNIAHPKYT